MRVLSLDGGGVRGVISAAILEALEEEMGLNIPIHQFFDLIVGTSTGMYCLVYQIPLLNYNRGHHCSESRMQLMESQ